MRKLKTFESFGPLYRQISTSQAKQSYKNRGDRGEDITKTEAEKISQFVKSIEGLMVTQHKNRILFINSNPAREVTITKGVDEWFYIFDDFGGPVGTWYECDGFEGLMKCLEKI